MHLNDILEENSIKGISSKTKIPEDNLEYLIASDFDALSKVKTFGFISILEREYNADLSAIRTQAEEYYGHSVESRLFPMGKPVVDDHKGKPKLLIFIIFLLFSVISWYFFTQFDKKNLNELIPFIDEETIENFMGNKQEQSEENITSDTLIISKKIIEERITSMANKSVNSKEDNTSDIVSKEDNNTENVTTSSTRR